MLSVQIQIKGKHICLSSHLLMKIWNFQFPICLETVITGVRLVTEYDNDFLTSPLKSVEGGSNKC